MLQLVTFNSFSLHLQLRVSPIISRNLHYSHGQHNAKVNTDAISKEYPVIDHEFDAIVVGAGMSFTHTLIVDNFHLIFPTFKVVLVFGQLSAL